MKKIFLLYVDDEIEGVFSSREHAMTWVQYLKATGCTVGDVCIMDLRLDGLYSFVNSEVKEGRIAL